MFVNPNASEILGEDCTSSIELLPEVPDLAIVATRAETVPGIIAELGEAGCRAAIVVSAGMDAAARQRMLEAANPYLLRILGPNCLGFLSPAAGINASFAPAQALPGGLALVSQSGAITTAMLDWGNGAGIGFSHLLSLGDMSDIDLGDLLDYLAFDPETHAILLYAENVTQARKFMTAARIAARSKPVIMVKSGRSASGARAAASHTGALAGSDAVYDAALRRAGILRVDSLGDLFAAAEALASGATLAGERLVVITNGGGLGVMAVDELEALGGKLATLTESALGALDEALPPAWSHGNPVDILGDAHAERYEAAISAIAAEFTDDAVLVINCPTGVADSAAAARSVINAQARHPGLPILCCWVGGAVQATGRKILESAGLPVYDTPEAAVRAHQTRVNRSKLLALLREAPAGGKPRPGNGDIAPLRALIARVIAEGRTVLTGPESREVLAAYDVPVTDCSSVKTPAEAYAAAQSLPGPFALKILSRDITHKSDVGGVRLGLTTPDAVEAAAAEMLATVKDNAPNARIDGFTLEPMVTNENGHELILGIASDATFGPCLLVGQGGTAAEVIADRSLGLPPLNEPLARDMVKRTRASRLLAGYRDKPAADVGAVCGVLVALSDLVTDFPEIAELDINPLLASPEGVLALDARIAVRAVEAGTKRLVIEPYPLDLVHQVETGGETYRIRPILPDDASRLVDMARLTDQEDLRLRFHGGIHALSETTAARLAQIDYDREMVLVAEESTRAIAGVVRLVFDAAFRTTELAVLVRSDAQGHGLGRRLLEEALAYAKSRGARQVFGDVMRENSRAIDLGVALGAVRTASPLGPTEVRMSYKIGGN